MIEQEEENNNRNDSDNKNLFYINGRVVNVLKKTTP